MIRELVPGRPLDLTDRVAVVALATDAAAAVNAASEGADAVLVATGGASECRVAVAAAGLDVPVLEHLEHLDPDDVVDLTLLPVEEAVARTTAAVSAGVRVLLADDVRTVRRAADVTVAVLLAGGSA